MLKFQFLKKSKFASQSKEIAVIERGAKRRSARHKTKSFYISLTTINHARRKEHYFREIIL